MFNKRVVVVAVALACLFAVLPTGMYAQTAGTVDGLVTDTSGAAIAGATVTLTDKATHGKFVLTDDRSMIDWGAFGAPRRVDCDDLYRQPQTALQHRRISLCVRPAVREEEVAMVR